MLSETNLHGLGEANLQARCRQIIFGFLIYATIKALDMFGTKLLLSGLGAGSIGALEVTKP